VDEGCFPGPIPGGDDDDDEEVGDDDDEANEEEDDADDGCNSSLGGRARGRGLMGAWALAATLVLSARARAGSRRPRPPTGRRPS
jgi:hypothetical protein